MPVRAHVTSYSFDAASDSRAVTVPAGCEVLEIAICTISSGQDQSSVTVGGQAMTRIGASLIHSGGKPRINVWRRISPPTGSQTVAITNASADKTGVAVNSWTDIDATTPFDGWATAQGLSATPSRTVTSATGDRVADAAASLSIGAFTPGAGQTELWDFVPVDGRFIGSHENGAASVTMSWTGTESKEWVIAGWNANAPSAPANVTIVVPSAAIATASQSAPLPLLRVAPPVATTTDSGLVPTVRVNVSVPAVTVTATAPIGLLKLNLNAPVAVVATSVSIPVLDIEEGQSLPHTNVTMSGSA